MQDRRNYQFSSDTEFEAAAVADPLQAAPEAETPLPAITNPEIELNHPDIPEVIATTRDVREPNLYKQIQHLGQQLRKQGLIVTLLEGYDQSIRLITGAPTLRFSRLNGSVFVGGQYNRRGWGRLAKRGMTAAVNMRGEYDEQKEGFAPSSYCHLPTVDNHAPTLEHLRKGVEFIHQELAAGGKVYIHCWEGVGRAPTMLAAYLVSTGLKPSEAWAQIKAIRPFIRPSTVQIQQVDLFAAEWASEDKRPLSERLPGDP